MQPGEKPEKHIAEVESLLHLELSGEKPPRTWKHMLLDAFVIVMGFCLAWGLALLWMVQAQ